MADKWTDRPERGWRDQERDASWRDRNWREREWRDREDRRAAPYHEDRSWPRMEDEDQRDERAFGRRRSAYGDDEWGYGPRSGVGSGAMGGGYGGGRDQAYSSGQGESRDRGWAPRFEAQDYTGRGARRWAEEGAGARREPWESDPDRGGTRDFERRQAWEDRDERRRDDNRPGDFLQRAGERISSWFRGDREEGERGHRGRGPKGYQRSDERINDEVHDRLTEDPWLDASNIEVQVKGGEVTLSGHVENREAKHRAERLVEDLTGVRHVQNNLRVEPSGLTGSGRGFGSSALEAEMRRNAQGGDLGGYGATETSVDPKTGMKRN